jgi:hypothetical protein
MFLRTYCLPFVLVAMSSSCFAEKGIEILLDGKRQQLLPLGYTWREVGLVGRNGYLLALSPDEMEGGDPKVVPDFRPFSQAEMRGALLREFRDGFDVTGTGNYLVVHPKGTRDLWANQFEELYRSMTHFFRTRGYPMESPNFPLVGIVFYSRAQYMDYLNRVLDYNASGAIGVYIPRTNRIYLYDATEGRGTKSKKWADNLATIMHEASHQTAFNTGIHIRLASTPRWLAEGLGCLFEAPGIYDAFHYKNQEDRINYGRLLDFKERVHDVADEVIGGIVASDKPFGFDPTRSYAASWALTFYLSEREPRNYIRYLKMVAKHEPLKNYGSSDRVAEFTTVFGRDHRMLSARVKRYIDDLPIPPQYQQLRKQ